MSEQARIGSPRRRTRWQVVRNLAWRALKAEVHGYLSIYRFVLRRPRAPRGAQPFDYHQPVLGVMITFVVVSAVELLVVDLLVHRWPYVRIPLLVLGVWGLVWMLGMLFGMLTRPHVVGPAGIGVRGFEVDIAVPWQSVDAVALRMRSRPEGAAKTSVDAEGRVTWHLWLGDQTNLEIELDRPTELRLPHGRETVDRIAFYAHDPSAFLEAVRRYIG